MSFCRLRRNERYGVCDDARQGGSLPIYLQEASRRSPPLHTSPPLNLLYQPKKRDRLCDGQRYGDRGQGPNVNTRLDFFSAGKITQKGFKGNNENQTVIQKGRSDGHGYGHSFIPVADDCVCSHGRCGYDLLYPYLRFGRKCDVLQLQRRDQRLHGRRYRQKQVPYVCRRFHGILYSAWCSVENWRHTERKFFGNLECSFSQSEKSCGPCASVWLSGQP